MEEGGSEKNGAGSTVSCREAGEKRLHLQKNNTTLKTEERNEKRRKEGAISSLFFKVGSELRFELRFFFACCVALRRVRG